MRKPSIQKYSSLSGVDGRKRYENDKCGRKSFWKRSKTVPFSFENGLVWTGPYLVHGVDRRRRHSRRKTTENRRTKERGKNENNRFVGRFPFVMYTVSSTPRREPLSVDPVRQAVPGTSVSENIPTSNESTQQNDSHQVCEFSFRGCNWCKDAQGFFFLFTYLHNFTTHFLTRYKLKILSTFPQRVRDRSARL